VPSPRTPCFFVFCYSNTFLFGFSLFLALEKERKYLINNVNATKSHSTVSEAPPSAQKIENPFFQPTAPFDSTFLFGFLFFIFGIKERNSNKIINKIKI
jgi:hypothetical protein